jgi:hypothetical protein
MTKVQIKLEQSYESTLKLITFSLKIEMIGSGRVGWLAEMAGGMELVHCG